MDWLRRIPDLIDVPTAVATVVLVAVVLLIIRVGRTLLLAAVIGALVAGVSLGEGSPLPVAGTHAGVAFGAVAGALFIWRWVRRLTLWFLVTALGGWALLSLACSRADGNTVRLPDQAARRGDDPPVMINPESPVEYPPTLLSRGIEGKVVLRLFVDESGRLSADSTRIAESSGYPALDSAALGAAGRFRFAPALRNGTAVTATFLQPIHFRHPEAGGTTP